MPSPRSYRSGGGPVKFLRTTLWVLLLPAILLSSLYFTVGLTFGGALFNPETQSPRFCGWQSVPSHS